MIFALVGNQNCGKTTLFNALTGSNTSITARFSSAAVMPPFMRSGSSIIQPMLFAGFRLENGS